MIKLKVALIIIDFKNKQSLKLKFISKEDDIEDWLHKTSHDGCFEQLNYEGDEYDQWLDDNFDMFWQEYCQDNALIYNDEYACLSF